MPIMANTTPKKQQTLIYDIKQYGTGKLFTSELSRISLGI